jgi:hypothetical protein
LDTGHGWSWSGTAWVDTGPFQGPAGNPGTNAMTTVATGFTVPPQGQSVSVNVADSSFATPGEMVYVAAAGAGGLAGGMQVTGKVTGQLTLLNPVPPSTIPLASPSGAGLLTQLSGNTTDLVDGSNNCQPIAGAVQPIIWSARLRSLNVLGNPNFEVDQRNVGNAVTVAPGLLAIDRWHTIKNSAATLGATAQQVGGVYSLVPGTNFCISRSVLRITLTTAQASLAATDTLQIWQAVEGSTFRELSQDVHSISILCQSSVANLNFSVYLQNNAGTYSIVYLCSLGAANTPTLFKFPSIPVWPTGGGWQIASGLVGYTIGVVLAAGSSFIAPATGTWQTSGNFVGASGMSNFAAQAVNSTFDIAFVQHEPGPQCTTLMDKPFSQNYDECLRYYQKSEPYSYSAVQVTTPRTYAATPSGNIYTPISYIKAMAKAPTITAYALTSNTASAVRDTTAGIDRGVSSVIGSSTSGFGGFGLASQNAGAGIYYFSYTADTGW